MILNILKRDLKRKKTMNIILLMFIILATMFVAGSANNIVSVVNGIGYYFDKANIGDYVVLTMGENVVGELDDFLENEKSIEHYRLENLIFAAEDKFSCNNKKIKLRNTALLQSLDDAELNFFDSNNRIISSVEKGKVYVTSDTMKKNNLKTGDKLHIKHGEVDITLEIAGKLKDALLGSAFMGNTRFLMSSEDFQLFESDENLKRYYGGQVCYIDTNDEKALEEALSDTDGIAFDGNRSLIQMCYLMDMIIAGVLLVVSACLIIISFVVLKFTITFTLTEEFREIGVMKAIGINDNKIRSLYIFKYMAIAIAGAAIGFFGSIPFSNALIKSVSENIVLGNDSGLLMQFLSAIFVIAVIVAYAYFCTRKVKKFSPLDAIRTGQSGERFRKKSIYRMSKSHLSTTGYMAVNDIISSPRRYLTIILAFAICSLLVFMIRNTTSTMQGDSLVTSFGKASDAYYTNVSQAMENMAGEGHTPLLNTLKHHEKLLADNGIPAVACVDVQYKYKVEFDNTTYKITCLQGVNTKTSDYEYYEGSAPQNTNEIAITERIAKKTGAKIGDTLKITVGDTTKEYLVTAYFQSMNLMGEVIRLHENVQTDLRDSSSMMSFQYDFTDNPSKAEIDRRIEKMKDIFDSDKVFNSAEYTADCIAVVDTMKSVEYLLLAITLIVVILVTILMERSFISDENGEIAILKAIGFKNSSIIAWHLKRFVIVGVISVLIAVLISVPMTNLCITPIFKIMGMKQVIYEFDLLQICLIYPAVILAVTVAAAGFTSLYTRKISSSDTAGLE